MKSISRVFSPSKGSPFGAVKWSSRKVSIADDTGKAIFEQGEIEAPESWSDLAVKIVASKYFYGRKGSDQRECSVKQLVTRVVNAIKGRGIEYGYFEGQEADLFADELAAILVGQYAAFNSPVWFNVGLFEAYNVGLQSRGNWRYDPKTQQAVRCTSQFEYPQASACFINHVEDDMESIMDLAKTEAMLFKYGSGTGTNLSTLRSCREKLTGGGSPSGPLSFLRIYDQVGNVVKSGGRVRRAAKINTLHDWHGDIEEFIEAKMIEEKKAHALIDQGYDGSFNGPVYRDTIAFQNENLSVRASDEFMKAATHPTRNDWSTLAVTTGEILEKKNAKQLLEKIALGTWTCGDPGMQFDDTLQAWHTCRETGRIESSNPCSEFVFLDDTACNLASINLLKFYDGKTFDIDKFQAIVRILIVAQDILVSMSSYPTPEIAENSYRYRPLGLGYANLGALIMAYGFPYDSDEGRSLAGAITSLMTATAYETSVHLADDLGPFEGLDYAIDARQRNAKQSSKEIGSNRESIMAVVHKHCDASHAQSGKRIEDGMLQGIWNTASITWREALRLGITIGFRNSQLTVLAPTGTISFMMDCDTTGIEPDISLVKYKTLSGGGNLKIVNQSVTRSLEKLGYTAHEVLAIVKFLGEHDTIEGSILKPEHYAVFDCALKPKNGNRFIQWEAHVKMMAATQPFISGSISKTINMPNESTPASILNAYVMAWKLGLKCVAIYRDGSKRSQPLNTAKSNGSNGNGNGHDSKELLEAQAKLAVLEKRVAQLSRSGGPTRRRLPVTRKAITHKFNVGGHEGYITVGQYDSGQPGELFVQMAKEGSTMGGLMDTIGTMVSILLQYGVPLDTLVSKFKNQRFEPHGMTGNKAVPMASSIIDYIFRWMESEFTVSEDVVDNDPISQPRIPNLELVTTPMASMVMAGGHEVSVTTKSYVYRDGQVCPTCGSSNVQVTGSCATCLNCATSLGCS